MKTTQWFHVVDEKPRRLGWYEYIGTMIDGPIRLYWNGRHFGSWLDGMWIHMLEDSTDYWRGLAEKP